MRIRCLEFTPTKLKCMIRDFQYLIWMEGFGLRPGCALRKARIFFSPLPADSLSLCMGLTAPLLMLLFDAHQ